MVGLTVVTRRPVRLPRVLWARRPLGGLERSAWGCSVSSGRKPAGRVRRRKRASRGEIPNEASANGLPGDADRVLGAISTDPLMGELEYHLRDPGHLEAALLGDCHPVVKERIPLLLVAPVARAVHSGCLVPAVLRGLETRLRGL